MIHQGPLWLVGCGNMGGAMLTGWLAAGLDPRQLLVINLSGRPPRPGIETLAAPPPDGAVPATVLLGVKPQRLDDVAPWLAPLLAPETLLVSILAGVELVQLRRRFLGPRAILRVMPNTPVAIGRGVMGLVGDGVDEAVRHRAETLLSPLGLVEWMTDEALFDLVTALAGSGPAFLYRFVDALAAAATTLGLPPEQAMRLAATTVEGSARLVAAADEPPSALADRVASPGGSTREGLDVLDAADGLQPLLLRTLIAAADRNREMAAAARS